MFTTLPNASNRIVSASHSQSVANEPTLSPDCLLLHIDWTDTTSHTQHFVLSGDERNMLCAFRLLRQRNHILRFISYSTHATIAIAPNCLAAILRLSIQQLMRRRPVVTHSLFMSRRSIQNVCVRNHSVRVKCLSDAIPATSLSLSLPCCVLHFYSHFIIIKTLCWMRNYSVTRTSTSTSLLIYCCCNTASGDAQGASAWLLPLTFDPAFVVYRMQG